MLRSFTTTTSSQVIREKVRGVQNFKILVGTTGRRPRTASRRPSAAGRHPRTAGMPPERRQTAAVRRASLLPSPPCLPKQPEACCHRRHRPSAAALWRGAMTRGDCRSRHFGTAVAVPPAPLGTKSPHLMLHSCWCRWGK